MRNPRALVGLIVALIAAIAVTYFSPQSSAPSSTAVLVAQSASTVAPTRIEWTAPIWTGGERNARQHWEKHGSEFPEFANVKEYVEGVHAFLLQPPPGTLTKHRDNGDTLYFNPSSGIFAVQASNSAPRTFFRPDNGMAYWNRQ